MKKIIIILLVFSSTFSSVAQMALDYEPIYDKTTWAIFKNGKLYVTLKDKGDSEYDKALIDAVKKHWTFNQFEFITDGSDKDQELHKSGENVFLFHFVLDKDIFIMLTNIYEGTKPIGMTGKYPDMFKVQLPDSTSNPNIYLPLGIKHIQWYCNLVASGKIKSYSDYKKEVKNNKHKIKEKPLYILDINLNDQVKNITDIKQHYKGEVYAVSAKELENILLKNEDINLFVCKVEESMAGPSRNYVQNMTFNYIYNMKTGELIYYDFFNHVNKIRPVGVNDFYLKDWNE